MICGILVCMQYKRKLEVDGKTIEYTLKKRRKQRNCSLAVQREGRITLTVPYWISLKRAEKFVFEKRNWLFSMLSKNPQIVTDSERKSLYVQHKESARVFVHQRLVELNKAYGFTYNRVAIRVNSSRWGSCSVNKNLNFDYRILFLPPHLQDYLIVHELCHLKEMNHSKDFWMLVAQTLPNHKKLRKELQKQTL